ncbi:chaplin [Streptomyces sp. NPDC048606]|uniref:chaplin n=1 Tax=Streptomyces sp. NPDC048606 TaxID=3154726 RepID=UPI0034463C65
MIKCVRVRTTAGSGPRRRVRTGVAALAAAVVSLVALAPASAADQDPAAPAVKALTGAQERAVADDLQTMGLQVSVVAGLIFARGDAATVNQAETRFADKDPMAMFTGLDQSGTGYLLMRGTNIAPWIGFTPGSGVVIQSVSNESDGETVVYDQATGHLNVSEDHHTAENLPTPHTRGAKTTRAGNGHGAVTFGNPGVFASDRIPVPSHIPSNICSNSSGVISALNPALGNNCLLA